MKLLIFILITLSFTLSYAGRIDHYYRDIAKVGKIHRPNLKGMFRSLRMKLGLFGLEQHSFYKAVRQGDLAKVKDFLNRPEIDPNQANSSIPPLFAAAISYEATMRGNMDMVELLLTHPRIDPNVKSGGYTILQFYSVPSAIKFNIKIAEVLLKHPKTDPNITDNNGFSALHIATSTGRSNMMELLLTHPRIDPNTKNEHGFAPIHTATTRNDLRSVNALLRHPDIRVDVLGGELGRTALEMASRLGYKEIAEAIQNHQNR